MANFSPHPQMRDGRLNECNSCRGKRRRELIKLDPSRRERERRRHRAWVRAHPKAYAESRRRSNAKYRDSIQPKKRNRRLQRKYGLTAEQVDAWIERVGNRCEVCGDPPAGRWRRLHIDHDHTTGKVRGLLCVGCNRAIGYLNDDPERAERVAVYLRHGGKRA